MVVLVVGRRVPLDEWPMRALALKRFPIHDETQRHSNIHRSTPKSFHSFILFLIFNDFKKCKQQGEIKISEKIVLALKVVRYDMIGRRSMNFRFSFFFQN